MSLIAPSICLIFLFLSHLSVSSATALEDCSRLSQFLPGQVFVAGNDGYNSSVSSYFYVQARLQPACVITPGRKEDVSSIVKLLRKSNTPFAVRGGGHGSVTGAANVQGGITIDLQRIKEVELSKSGDIVSVGAGASWDQVYSVLDQRNLSALGGRASRVGVGGLLTGGGISFFSPNRGFACDYVTNFEVVLADGTITDANAYHDRDLFVALKGGSNNFGVVTRFDLKTFTQNPYWGGGIAYNESTVDQLLSAFNKFKRPENFDPYAEIELSLVYLGAVRTFLAASSLFYSKPIVNASALLPFVTPQPQLSNSLRISNTSDFANEIFSLSTFEQYSVWASTTFAITPTILSRIRPIWKAHALEINSITNVTSSMTLQSIPPPPPAWNPNSLGFSPFSNPEKNLVLLLISNFFPDGKAYTKVDEATKSFIAAIDKVANDEGVNKRYTYLNYAAGWQDVLRDYGSDEYEDLRKTARKYDPSGFFQKQTGGFKLY